MDERPGQALSESQLRAEGFGPLFGRARVPLTVTAQDKPSISSSKPLQSNARTSRHRYLSFYAFNNMWDRPMRLHICVKTAHIALLIAPDGILAGLQPTSHTHSPTPLRPELPRR
jgi:hypothetical protein